MMGQRTRQGGGALSLQDAKLYIILHLPFSLRGSESRLASATITHILKLLLVQNVGSVGEVVFALSWPQKIVAGATIERDFNVTEEKHTNLLRETGRQRFLSSTGAHWLRN